MEYNGASRDYLVELLAGMRKATTMELAETCRMRARENHDDGIWALLTEVSYRLGELAVFDASH